MITLISTPARVNPDDPADICRWIATESPNNFRLQRSDFIPIAVGATSGGYLGITPPADFSGAEGDSIVVVDDLGNTYTGEITDMPGADYDVETDIVYSAIVGNVDYFNDHTLRGGYYFEGRLKINGVLHPLTIIASPDTQGYADLDVSGILRIVTSLGKNGDYSSRIMAETNKSGNFSFEYRECWYGSDNPWYPEGGELSPPSDEILWYYVEAVRSEEQGSNLYDYVATDDNPAPFFNQFEEPVYFKGLPFDLTFLLPETHLTSPEKDITVEINCFNSANVLIDTISEIVDVDSLDGHACSLNISRASIPEGASYFTAEITI